MRVSAVHIDRLENHLSPRTRFLLGAAILILFVLQKHPLAKLAEVLLFGALAFAAGKHIRWGYFLIMVSAITVFNILSPWGEVLARLGPLAITKGALTTGVIKGLTLVGMIFVSLFTVSRRLTLPGRFGAILARTLFYFERLYSERKSIRRDHLVEDIDRILETTLAAGVAPAAPAGTASRNTTAGLVVAVVLLVTLTAALLIPPL